MNVSFDSNAWEKLFNSNNDSSAVIDALKRGTINGYLCEAAFRIEAIQKDRRTSYFNQPRLGVGYEGPVVRNGQQYLLFTLGPIDGLHPGLHPKQQDKLQKARDLGFLIMRGLNWMGLPRPHELQHNDVYVPETKEQASARELRQIEVFDSITGRGVGKAMFDAADGWNGVERNGPDKSLIKACAEWADGELAAAHIAYGNDILCTDDFGCTAGISVFDSNNRRWLGDTYGIEFRTLKEIEERF